MATWVFIEHASTGKVDVFKLDNDLVAFRHLQWMRRWARPLLRFAGQACWDSGDRVRVMSNTRVWTRDACAAAEAEFRLLHPDVEIKFVETPPCPGCGQLQPWYAVCVACHQASVNEQRCFAKCADHQRPRTKV